METDTVWNDLIPEKDGVKLCVHDIAISPDGSRLIAAVGNRVLFYRTSDGDLLDSLRGHKDTVYCVSYSSDGTKFASGGADNVVVIWKGTGQGLLKYNHSAPIQRVCFNPTMVLLASCSEVDFGLWTPDQKQVIKEKVASRILSASWSSDGSYLAIGMLNGLVSIRNIKAEEVMKVERKAPVWCLSFIPEAQGPSRSTAMNTLATSNSNSQGAGTGPGGAFEHVDNLVIGCWDKTYNLYKLTGRGPLLQIEKKLSYYPLSIKSVHNYAMKTSYVILSGSNKQVQVFSREGIKLADVSKMADSWIWCADCSAEEETLALGTNTGMIEFNRMKFSSVHAFYLDRFAYRENLTEVIVHHLTTDKKVRIKCKDMIHHLSLFRNKLAVQLLDRICIYESNVEDSTDIHFRLRRDKILLASASFNLESKIVTNLMVVTTGHVFTSLDHYLELYSGADGQRIRLWKMDSKITCLRLDGGQDGHEGVLVGLQDGSVQKYHVDTPFATEVFARRGTGSGNGNNTKGILHACMNIYRSLIATIDHEHTLLVSEVATQEVIYRLEGNNNGGGGVIAACFNAEVDDLLCITEYGSYAISVISGLKAQESIYVNNNASNVNNNMGLLGMRGAAAASAAAAAGNAATAAAASLLKAIPEIQEQHICGTVVGFRGQKISSVSRQGILTSVDVPQGGNISKALEIADYTGAYKIACLGATEIDWRLLAMKALRANQLNVAKNAFARLKDTRYLSLIEQIERTYPEGPSTANVATGAGGESSTGISRRNAAGGGKAATITPSTKSNSLEPKWLAEIMAYEGHYHEAAKIFARSGMMEEAIKMFTLLRKWEEAKTYARNSGNHEMVIELTSQQAKWLQEIKDWKGASELFMSMQQYEQAAHIIGENNSSVTASPTTDAAAGGKSSAAVNNNGWQAAMLEVVRACSPTEDKDTILYCAEKLSSYEDMALAREAYMKINDYAKIMALYITREMWTEAAKLADDYQGKFDMSVFASYAEWLVAQDRYEEAMEAFKKSGRLDLSRKVLTELTLNAVAEHRFKDAGYYYWLLAKELELEVTAQQQQQAAAAAKSDKQQESKDGGGSFENNKIQLISECEHKADLYFAYAVIYAYVIDPFTTYQPEMLFQVARFIINSLGISDTIPQGISKTFTLYTLAKQAMQLGAFKLARNAYDRLSRLKIPDRKIEEVELDMLLVQAKPVRDDPDHLPVCYRCGSVNPLLNPFTNRFAKGDVCTNCGHPFVRSFINFDILPLVEFVPEPSIISDDEAIEMIRQPPTSRSQLFGGGGGGGGSGRGGESKSGNANVLTLDNNNDMDQSALGDHEAHDLFTHCLNLTLERQKTSYIPVQVDSTTLLAMKRSEVFVCKPSSKNKRATFYKNMLPEIAVAISQPCHRFFHQEDFEFAYLSEKKCPYSRLTSIGEYGSI